MFRKGRTAAKSDNVSPGVRVAIMLVATATAAFLSWHYMGAVLPSDPRAALLFQNTLLLIVLGSALLEHHYTKPADAVVNFLMGMITLLSVFSQAPRRPWILVVAYCGFVFCTSTVSVALSSRTQVA